MQQRNRPVWQSVSYAFLFLAVVSVLFFIYTAQNQGRIQEQNRVYAEDCARQTAERIGSEFDDALQRVESCAYLVGTDGEAPRIDQEMLREMERNTSFDAVRFTDVTGMNLTSDGRTSDSSDREYFIRGMSGESGIEVVRRCAACSWGCIFPRTICATCSRPPTSGSRPRCTCAIWTAA